MSEGDTQSLGGGGDVTRSTAPIAGAALHAPAPHIPSRIGRYTIVRVLGEGGMGTVYEAQQESPKRAVALKVIRSGYLSPQLLKRFEHESHVLGRLQHPGIAQVYEAGVFEAEPPTAVGGSNVPSARIPFFAMEFIKGVPLTEYASAKRLGTRERLDLVARICDAVYHAHQKGVIHRDLKPGNILVDESGQPKILDFGVARATDSDIQQTTLQTDIGQLIGTVPYMSPEQVSGDPSDLDTRSDVYALGVIAYELLAGRLPYDLQRKVIHEAARIIKEEEPTRLSSINRTLRGDVETIVAKALEKEKHRRYQSAESFASDIRRYLKDEPITARPASTWYQLQKFSRRNTGLVVGVAAAFVFLSAGLVLALISRADAVTARDNETAAHREADAQRDAAIAAKKAEEAQRKEAESQRDQAETIAVFMSDTLKGAGPSVALRRDITMLKEMMDAAAARIEKGELKKAPDAELRLRGAIGLTYRLLAVYDSAQKMLEPAVPLARATHPGDHKATGDALNGLALLLQDRGNLAGAEPLMRESLEMRQRLSPGDNPDVASGLNNLALLLRVRGNLATAEPLFRASLEMKQRLFPGDNADVAACLNNLAMLLKDRGDLKSSESLYRQALEMQKRVFPGDHPDVATALNNLGNLLKLRGDPDEAEPLFREAVEMGKRVHKGDHPDVASFLHNLASLLKDRGDLDGAESLYRESLEMRRRLFKGDHPDIAASLNNLAALLNARDDLAGAEALYRESLEMKQRLYPRDHPSVAAGLTNLATLLKARGDLAGAEPLSREAVAMYKRLFPAGHPNVANALINLANLLKARADVAKAEALYREVLELRIRLLGAEHRDTLIALLSLAGLLVDSGRYAEAAPLIDECIEKRTRKLGPAHADTREAIDLAVTLYESWDKAEPGKGYDAKAAEWKSKLEGPPAASQSK